MGSGVVICGDCGEVIASNWVDDSVLQAASDDHIESCPAQIDPIANESFADFVKRQDAAKLAYKATKAARFRFACEWRTDGTPVAQPRVRAVSRGRHASVYDPGTANAWKAAIVAAGERHKPAAPLQGPLRVVLRFYFPRPKRLLRKKDPVDRIPHTAKPDADNLVKAVLDCLTGAGWWNDDAQVCDVSATKWYVNKGGTPGLVAFVTQVEAIAC